tara:strand:+ start:1983 stop:3131 length:1149 start_codon:yes stop_codon:yes gene_type:complete
LFGNVHDILRLGQGMGEGDWSQLRDDDGGLTAVIEFLSAFTLFLMILTAFMSLAQLEMGSNDTEIDRVDQAVVSGLDRLITGPGWFVPSDGDGGYDYANGTKDWNIQSAEVLELGRVQTGLVSNNQLDISRVSALSNVTLEGFSQGLGLDNGLTAFLRLSIQASDNESRIGLNLFEGGANLDNARMASTASGTVRMGTELVLVTLEVHDAGRANENLILTEAMVRPISGGPEWIEVYNDNAFATSLYGWSFNTSSASNSNEVLLQQGVISGHSVAIFTGSLSSQQQGNASQMFDLGQYGLLGTGSMNLLSDGEGAIELRFTRPGQINPVTNSMVDWGGQTGLIINLNQVLVWEGGNSMSSASWSVQQDATPGEVFVEPSNAS